MVQQEEVQTWMRLRVRWTQKRNFIALQNSWPIHRVNCAAILRGRQARFCLTLSLRRQSNQKNQGQSYGAQGKSSARLQPSRVRSRNGRPDGTASRITKVHLSPIQWPLGSKG